MGGGTSQPGGGGGGQGGGGGFGGQQNYQKDFMKQFGRGPDMYNGAAGPGGGKPIMPFMGGGYPQPQVQLPQQPLTSLPPSQFGGLGGLGLLGGTQNPANIFMPPMRDPGYGSPMTPLVQKPLYDTAAPAPMQTQQQANLDQAYQQFLQQQQMASQPTMPMPSNPMAVPQQVRPEDDRMRAMRQMQRPKGPR
jgi:hypothetical protein